MSNKDLWHLDDEGRLYRAMKAQDRNRSDWHGLPAATSRGARAADRLLNGVIVILHLVVAATVGAFALATLGYISFPDKAQTDKGTVTTAATTPIVGDGCDS
jgi:hypothetical protein